MASSRGRVKVESVTRYRRRVIGYTGAGRARVQLRLFTRHASRQHIVAICITHDDLRLDAGIPRRPSGTIHDEDAIAHPRHIFTRDRLLRCEERDDGIRRRQNWYPDCGQGRILQGNAAHPDRLRSHDLHGITREVREGRDR